MIKRSIAALLFLALATVSAEAQAVDTRLVVRVISHDAKIIGSGVGGARVTVTDAATGEVLAQGIQQGSTGDTRAIMVEPRRRGGTVYDTEGSAAFTTTLSLAKPTMVEVMAEGPLGTPHAVQRASKTLLLVPGRHVSGEGLLLELMGFTVQIMAPEAGDAPADNLAVRAKVTMLCGCPTKPGGMWDSDKIEVVARLLDGEQQVAETTLGFAGETSVYQGTFGPQRPGTYRLQILALESSEANFGVATREVTLR